MKNVHKVPGRCTVSDEAYNWLIELDRDEPPSKQRLAELEAWLKTSPANRQELIDLAAFWSNNALTELEVPLVKHNPQRAEKVWHFKALAATALAGVLAFALVVSVLLPQAADNHIYVTAVGQQKVIELNDGSTLELNTNTQIQVDFTGQYRNVRLIQGEAFFQIAKNPKRPFRVYAGAGRVQAVGTAFTVYLQQDMLNVLVSEGKVVVASLANERPDAGAVSAPPTTPNPGAVSEFDPYVNDRAQDLGTLVAGQSIQLGDGDGVAAGQQPRGIVRVLAPGDIARRQAWRDGFLVFAGEPLATVVAEVSRYTTVSIEIVDPALKQVQIGGRFKVGKVDDMLAALETNIGIKVNRLNYNQVQLTAK